MIQRNLFQTIRQLGYDDDFEPYAEATPTGAPPGGWEKVCVLIDRLERGQELHHPGDERRAASPEQQTECSEKCRLATEEHKAANAANRAERLEACGRSGSEGWRRSRCKERVG